MCKKLTFYLCAQHIFVLFKYKAVVNSRTYLNSKHCLGSTDTCELLAEVNDEIEEEKQAQQRKPAKGGQNCCQTSYTTENTQKTISRNILNLITHMFLSAQY